MLLCSEQRLNNPSLSVIASKKMEIKCDGAAKTRRRRDRSVDDFDAVEIRRSSSTKFDGAAVYWTVKLVTGSTSSGQFSSVRVMSTRLNYSQGLF